MKAGSHVSSNESTRMASIGLSRADRAATLARIAAFDAEIEAACERGLRAIALRGGMVPHGCRYSDMDRRAHYAPQYLDGRSVLVGDPRAHKLATGGAMDPFPGGFGPGTGRGVCKEMARVVRVTRGLS